MMNIFVALRCGYYNSKVRICSLLIVPYCQYSRFGILMSISYRIAAAATVRVCYWRYVKVQRQEFADDSLIIIGIVNCGTAREAQIDDYWYIWRTQ